MCEFVSVQVSVGAPPRSSPERPLSWPLLWVFTLGTELGTMSSEGAELVASAHALFTFWSVLGRAPFSPYLDKWLLF